MLGQLMGPIKAEQALGGCNQQDDDSFPEDGARKFHVGFPF